MNKKSLLLTFMVIFFTVLLSSCYRTPVTPPPTPACPPWGCGTFIPDVTKVTASYTQTSLPPTNTPLPTDQPTITPTLLGEEAEKLICVYRVDAVEYSTANQYLDTGLILKPGETLIIEATGTACFDAKLKLCTGPNGNPNYIDTDLVGKIGDGSMFHIGTNLEKTVFEETGNLYLAFHDNDFENNSGYFDVTISIANSLTKKCPLQ